MMHRWGATLILAILISFAKTSGQNIAFNHLTVENGLSHNSVLAITQDSRGFMWYGTRYGLNRYDGQRFKIYKADRQDTASLSDNLILSLFCDSKKTLWVGTVGGLNRYNAEKDIIERVPVIPDTQFQLSIVCIFEDKKGRFWIGTQAGLYLRTSAGFKQIASANGIAGPNVRCIYEDQKGYLWIGTNSGLTRMIITGDNYQFENFRHEEGNTGSLPVNYITAITSDAQGRLWIGTQTAGVCMYDPASRSFIRIPHDNIANSNIREIITDRAGKLWIGTQEGLSVVDPVTKTGITYQHSPGNRKSLSQNSIHSLFEDINGSIWVGTYFGGLNMVHSYNTSFTTWQNNDTHSGISNNVVSSILEDAQHNLWIGTEGGGLNYLNRRTGAYTYYKHDPVNLNSLGSNLVKFVYKDKDRNIWIGTHGGGLNMLENGKFKRFLHDKQDPNTFTLETTAILEDSYGKFWVGTNSGLHLFRRQGSNLTEINDTALLGATAQNSIRYLFEDSQRRLWIGTTNYLYILKDNKLRVVNTNCYNNSITEDAKGNIWVSLYYGGLIQYAPDLKIITRYTDKDGLPSNNILGLLEDDKQNLWTSTDNGLVKFDPNKKTFQTYTTSDGIAGNEFNYGSFLEDSRGEFFFGGYNGITSFFPGKIEANTYTAPIVFTGLKLFNEPVGINNADKILKQDLGFTKELRFKHDQEVFTIEFALLNYIKSSKNRYAYKLEGFDRDWNETNNTSVTYTNLPSGTYTFLVKGANNDGVWSAPAQLSIKVLPPFWRTWWAYCIYALLAASVFFLVTRFFFLRALLTKEEELHQVKLNFFTNISHEIRTHLTLLMAPVEKMMDTYKKDGPLQQQLSNVKNNANRLLKLVSELMDFRKAETNHLKLHIDQQDIIPFLEEIYTSFSELSQSRQIKTSFVHNKDHAFIYFDGGQLEKVLFNLLTNAFKFTPDGGFICLNVEVQKTTVAISVIDNGRGIAPEYQDKLFSNFFQVADHGLQNTGYGIGLALSKNIVELHKGTLTVESEPAINGKEGRTCFTITLLQGHAHFVGTQHVLGNNPTADSSETTPIIITTKSVMGNNPSAKSPAGDKPFTLLIVEDNPELRQLVRETFQHTYQVLESENGAQGLAMATEQIPDLVISDVMMPEMDGLEFCSRLKTDERTSHIPVVLLTAKSAQADHVSGLENGADLYLSKPFSTKVLELNVRNLLALREKMRLKFSRQLLTETPGPLPNTVDDAFLQKVIQLVEEHMDEPEFGVEMLSRKVAMSQPVLYKKLKALTDMSVNDFVKSLRLKKAASLILKKQHTVYEVAYMVGYSDRKYFSKEFKKQFGKTPTEFAGERETE